jgi:hypothetical protein
MEWRPKALGWSWDALQCPWQGAIWEGNDCHNRKWGKGFLLGCLLAPRIGAKRHCSTHLRPLKKEELFGLENFGEWFFGFRKSICKLASPWSTLSTFPSYGKCFKMFIWKMTTSTRSRGSLPMMDVTRPRPLTTCNMRISLYTHCPLLFGSHGHHQSAFFCLVDTTK